MAYSCRRVGIGAPDASGQSHFILDE
jgi:hypothetical protein